MYVCMYVQEQNLYFAALNGNLAGALAALDREANINWQNEDHVRERNR